MLFIVRQVGPAYGGVRVATDDAADALLKARTMEERGLAVEIADPVGATLSPDDFEASGRAAGLTSERVALIQGTCDVLLAADSRAADIFYDRLFALAPDARALFPDDLAAQKRKLLDMLGSLVGYLAHPDMLAGALRGLGRRHATYGALPAHYGPTGAALLASLEQLLGPRFTPEVKAAWTALYAHLSAAMLKAAARG